LPLADARRAMPDVKLSAAEMKLAELVVTQAMAGTFDPHSIKDERSDKLLALINMAAQSAGAVVKATASRARRSDGQAPGHYRQRQEALR
jgi:non-homologous end joining protein Ku